MSTPPKYQVFISSTFDDLKQERTALWQRLTDHGYIVSGMENFPSTSDDPFEYIKPLIDESDYFLLIVGDRYGSDFQNTGQSYTETEFEYALNRGIPVLTFPIDETCARSRRSTDVDKDRADRLQAFRQRACSGRMVRAWSTPDDLASVAIQALSFESRRKPRPGWVRANLASNAKLIDENIELRARLSAMQEMIDGQSTMSLDRMVRELAFVQNLSAKVKGKDGYQDFSFRLSRLLRLEPLFAAVSFTSIVGSIEIIGETELELSRGQLSVSPLIVDAIILRLRRLGIIDFDVNDSAESIRKGPNWVTALEAAKLGPPDTERTGDITPP